MKKLVLLTLIIMLSSAVLVDLALAGKAPPEPPPIFQSYIVNEVTEPVPVAGVVDIGSFLTPVAVTGTVDIGNLPTPAPNPLKEPLNWGDEFKVFDFITYYSGSCGYTVPSGKQLTVETVTIRAEVPANNVVEPYLYCDSGDRARHDLKPWTYSVGVDDGNMGVRATESIKCHMPPGRTVYAGVKSTTGEGYFRCSISGFLENVPLP
jgi:hypothetical protein